MQLSVYALTLVLLSLSPLATCHVFRLGECPAVEPMVDFEIERFLGEWYVVQKFRSASDCIKENFTRLDNEDRYFVTRDSKLFGSPILSTVKGEIFFPHNGSQSEMEVDYPLSSTGIVNIKHYVVLATDYENYALVWNCQQVIVGHRQSAQIMSRTDTLDKKMVAELRELLANYDLNEHYFTIVKQKGCDYDYSHRPSDKPFVGINIDCDKDRKPGQRRDGSGMHLRIGPFHFSATLPFKK